APYCASKYAIEGLTQALAKDLVEVGADGVATVPFNPGRVQTEMLRTAYGDAIADTTITPTEWAAMALPVLLALGPADSGRSINAPRPASEAR
ncbi:MAG: SDR family NAD(P)-dependent oxidoreductase, partial [Acidobacteriota bacterium]